MALAVVEVEHEVVFEDVVVRRKAEGAGRLVDGWAGTFKFDEGADGGFVEIDDQVLGPFEAGGEAIGGAEFFVPEPSFKAEAFEDSLEGSGVGEEDFDLLADFVAMVGVRSGGADGELLGRRFESKERAGGRLFGGELLPFRRGGFGADAEELTMLGEATVGGVEDEVVLVDTRGGGLGAEFFEGAEEGFGVGEADLDFGFAGHGGIVRESGGSWPRRHRGQGKRQRAWKGKVRHPCENVGGWALQSNRKFG